MAKVNYFNNIEAIGGLTLIDIHGSISRGNLKEIQSQYDAVTKGRAMRHVVFNVKDATSVDSSSIAAVIDLIRYMKEHHIEGKVGLLNVSEPMMNLLDVSKVGELIKIYKSKDDAIKELAED
jgi:anti-anti-sigma factor